MREYAKAQNFDIVIAEGVIYATPTVDITAAVLAVAAGACAEAGRRRRPRRRPRSHPRSPEAQAPLRDARRPP